MWLARFELLGGLPLGALTGARSGDTLLELDCKEGETTAAAAAISDSPDVGLVSMLWYNMR